MIFWLILTFSPSHAEERPIKLFDGRSLTGWTTDAGESVAKGWVVEDGMLVGCGGGGSIFTAKEYGDFDLSFQWRIAPRGNSGVKYRVAYYKKGVHGLPGWLGCEYQIFDDVGRGARPRFSSGAIYALYAPAAEATLQPIGKFNDARIVVHGSKIEHWLNGTQVVEADTATDDWKHRIAGSKFGVVDGFFKNRRGHIELQDHGSRVWFRNLVLIPLEAE